QVQPWARCAARLLRGALYQEEEEHWNKLIIYKTEIIHWFEQIAIDLVIDQRDGYAYLRQLLLDDKDNTVGLVQRRPLSYEVTLLCVILRKMLDDFEMNDASSRNLYITRKLLRVELESFFKEKANRLKLVKELNRYIDEVVELGYLKRLRADSTHHEDDSFEVRPILKARFDDNQLQYFLEQLKPGSQAKQEDDME
ncbi:MAG TPA: DUF4194 domain-containing protein, partial [Phnomibacter sp.]|nr:DUF4194 domain-containing protein [Phnomibacter sp.]